MRASRRFWLGGVMLGGVLCSGPVAAQSLSETLAHAYTDNPTLNAARSTGRATDEGVPIALSGYRPTINGAFSVGATDGYKVAYPTYTETNRQFYPQTMTLTVVQPLFTGFRVENGVKQSEAAVRAQREILRNTEESVLLQAATAFADVIRDTALLQLAESNLAFLNEQVKADTERFHVGEGTRTDQARSEAQMQQSMAQKNAATAQLALSRATYRQVVGQEAKALSGGLTPAPGLPKAVAEAEKTAQAEHPAILASQHNVDVAAFNVKMLEGALLPQLSAQGQVAYAEQPALEYERTTSQSASLNLSVPLYQGGAEYAKVRQAKESLNTAQIQVDGNRAQVRAQVDSYFEQMQAARASIEAAKAQIAAGQLTLDGVIEERRVGQKTNVDVLNAQAALVNAKSALATAERNHFVAAYALLSSVGHLDAAHLKLKVARYAPEQHYAAVRDAWGGLRTPDGR